MFGSYGILLVSIGGGRYGFSAIRGSIWRVYS